MLLAILKISLILFDQKQKLQLSKLKSAILQMNTRYYRDCYTENANKTNCMEFTRKDEWHPNSSGLKPLNYHVWYAKVEIYQRNSPKPTNTYGTNKNLAIANKSRVSCININHA